MLARNKLGLSLTVALVALGVGVYFFFAQKQEKTAPQPATTPAPIVDAVPATNATESMNSSKKGVYTIYNNESFAASTDTRLLFFHATWCPQCRALDKSITDGMIPKGVTIFKVDYDSNQQLRQKYGVTLQTTVVKVDAGGNTAKKFIAYDKPNLDAVVENLLP